MENFEELDIDTSDLESFIKRCNPRTTLILGPAGNVQVVMLNRSSDDALNTQQFVKELGNESYRRDFGTNAWEWALKFIEFHGLVDGDKIKEVMPLAKGKTSTELSLVPCVVKECQPNDLGDMKITIRDPSASTEASVHRKVLQHPEIGTDVAVGSVLILKNVKVFSPNRRVFYLNIMLNNIVKVFKSDIGPPNDEELRTSLPIIQTGAVVDPNHSGLVDNIANETSGN